MIKVEPITTFVVTRGPARYVFRVDAFGKVVVNFTERCGRRGERDFFGVEVTVEEARHLWSYLLSEGYERV